MKRVVYILEFACCQGEYEVFGSRANALSKMEDTLEGYPPFKIESSAKCIFAVGDEKEFATIKTQEVN